MTFYEPGIYHVYNRGNFKQPIFHSPDNYFYFLKKCRKYLAGCSDILAWCLMPNHFHFLLNITFKSIEPIKSGGIILPTISNGFRLLQSSYTKSINYQMKRTGNLFQQKTKSKLITDKDGPITAFNYIHQNPVTAHLVTKAEEWDYSSFPDYAGLRNGMLCNKEKTYELLGLSPLDIRNGARREITADLIKSIY